MESESTGLCVVGLGSISTYHIEAISLVEGVHLAAVVSRSAEKAEAIAKKFETLHCYTTVEDAVTDPEIDAFVICTPTQLHYEEALQCVLAGKPILLEKPVTDSFVEAEKLAGEAENRGVTIMAAQVSRFLEPYARCKQIIADGGIGRPLQGIETRLMHRRVFLPWFIGAKGHLINHWGSHPIDLFPWFFGARPVSVYCSARASLSEAGGEDDVVLCMELANDAIGTCHFSYHSRSFDMNMILIGDAGTLLVEWEGPPGSAGKGQGLSSPQSEDQALVHLLHNNELIFEAGVERVSSSGFVDQLQEFLEALGQGRAPRPSITDTIVTMATVEAARESAREHRVVAIDEIRDREKKL